MIDSELCQAEHVTTHVYLAGFDDELFEDGHE